MNDGILGWPLGSGALQSVGGWPLALGTRLPAAKYALPVEATQEATVASAGSGHTKGTWTVLGTAPWDADGFFLRLGSATGAITDHLTDIGIGRAGGADRILIENLLYTGVQNAASPVYTHIPLGVRAGESLVARTQSGTASDSLGLSARFVAGGIAALMRCEEARTYGANLADSGGTQIDPGGSATTKGAWVELAANLELEAKMLLLNLGNLANSVETNQNAYFDLGWGQDPLADIRVPDIYFRTNAADDGIDHAWHDFFVTACAGDRISMRASSSTTDATDRLLDAVLIAFS